MVPDKSRSGPLAGGHSKTIGGMWTLKHEINSPIFYELLINKEFKGDTDVDSNNFLQPYQDVSQCGD